MGDLTEEGVLENYCYWAKAVRILSLNNQFTLRDMANCMGVLETSICFRMILAFLEEFEFITIDKLRIPHLINVDKKKLSVFLRKGTPFKENELIIKCSNPAGLYSY